MPLAEIKTKHNSQQAQQYITQSASQLSHWAWIWLKLLLAYAFHFGRNVKSCLSRKSETVLCANKRHWTYIRIFVCQYSEHSKILLVKYYATKWNLTLQLHDIQNVVHTRVKSWLAYQWKYSHSHTHHTHTHTSIYCGLQYIIALDESAYMLCETISTDDI